MGRRVVDETKSRKTIDLQDPPSEVGDAESICLNRCSFVSGSSLVARCLRIAWLLLPGCSRFTPHGDCSHDFPQLTIVTHRRPFARNRSCTSACVYVGTRRCSKEAQLSHLLLLILFGDVCQYRILLLDPLQK